MKRVLITTTINVPTALTAWRTYALDDDDVIIVSGDQKTPHDGMREFLATLPGTNIYLAPEDQKYSLTGRTTGWNCIQRRNVALLEAIKLAPEYIITMDDDNYVRDDDFKAQLDDSFTGENGVLVSSSSGWFNVGNVLEPRVTVRGFPLTERHALPIVDRMTDSSSKRVDVVASLWLGEPDIDAIERMVLAPSVTAMNVDHNIILDSGTWCPFNSQATAFSTKFAPFMMVWPDTGRYDDIWASFLTQRALEVSDSHVSFGRPLVYQDRNPHDLMKDLSDELYGMKYNVELANALRGLPDVGPVRSLEDAMTILDTWYDLIVKLSFISNKTATAIDAWYNDLIDVIGFKP